MAFKRITVALLLAVSLAACQGSGPKQTIGTLGGAGLGALAGSAIGSGKGQLAAVAIGALVGAYAGSEVGKSLDRADQQYLERTSQNSLEYNRTGQTSSWRNPDSGHSGTVTPTRTYQSSAGSACREYETTIFVDGREETAYGRACRQSDGTWQLAN
ncbi:MAG: glycine zipper 2TM domain-containing protein [Rhodobacterales bacterium]|nr:glycine zipper 2TM domain-containing protein [Rhodobacterales bacterium]